MFNIYCNSWVPLTEYMELSREIRRQHLNLSKPCVDIGGSSRSSRALLGMFLGTTCEGLGMRTGYLCHACGNEKCSNPEHLYWGTSSDNSFDKYEHQPGLGKEIFQRKINKYGKDYAKNLSKNRVNFSSWNKFTPKEVEIRLNLVKDIDLLSYGWLKQVAERLNISSSAAREFIYKYYNGSVYKRTSPKSRA